MRIWNGTRSLDYAKFMTQSNTSSDLRSLASKLKMDKNCISSNLPQDLATPSPHLVYRTTSLVSERDPQDRLEHARNSLTRKGLNLPKAIVASTAGNQDIKHRIVQARRSKSDPWQVRSNASNR